MCQHSVCMSGASLQQAVDQLVILSFRQSLHFVFNIGFCPHKNWLLLQVITSGIKFYGSWNSSGVEGSIALHLLFVTLFCDPCFLPTRAFNLFLYVFKKVNTSQLEFRLEQTRRLQLRWGMAADNYTAMKGNRRELLLPALWRTTYNWIIGLWLQSSFWEASAASQHQ